MLFKDAARLMLLECKSRRLSKDTIRYYTLVLSQCNKSLGDKNIKTITVHDLRGVLLSAPVRSTPHYYSVLKRTFNFLMREELLKRNPAAKLDPPRVAKKVIQALETTDISKMLKAAKENVHRGHNNIRDVVIITMLVATGLRRAELCNLQDEDVRIDQGVMLVNGKGNKQRLVPIPSKLKPMLLRYTYERNKSKVYDARQQWFFRGRHGGKLEPDALTQLISKTAQRAGIKAHTHRLRHSFATMFMSNPGADILTLQAICGWASVSMAERYAHVTMSKLKSSMESFTPLNDL